MTKRLIAGLATGLLAASMLPGAVSAAPRFDQVKVHARGALSGSVIEAVGDFHVTARARGPGVEATGVVWFRLPPVGRFTADVECLYIDGDFASVVARIRGQSPFPSVTPFIIIVVEDNGGPGQPTPDAGFAAAMHRDDPAWVQPGHHRVSSVSGRAHQEGPCEDRPRGMKDAGTGPSGGEVTMTKPRLLLIAVTVMTLALGVDARCRPVAGTTRTDGRELLDRDTEPRRRRDGCGEHWHRLHPGTGGCRVRDRGGR